MVEVSERVQQLAQQIVDNGGVIQVSIDIFRVQSQSKKEEHYYVMQTPNWKCDCPYFLYHRIECKHIQAVKIFLAPRAG